MYWADMMMLYAILGHDFIYQLDERLLVKLHLIKPIPPTKIVFFPGHPNDGRD
jgi:hypothetical protein